MQNIFFTFFLAFLATPCPLVGISIENNISYIALRAPHGSLKPTHYDAIITAKVTNPDEYALHVIWYDPQSKVKKQDKWLYLNQVTTKKESFLFENISFNTRSQAEYRIFAYRINQETKKIIEPVKIITDILAINPVASAPPDFYASLFHKPKQKFTLKRKLYLASLAIVGALASGSLIVIACEVAAVKRHYEHKR